MLNQFRSEYFKLCSFLLHKDFYPPPSDADGIPELEVSEKAVDIWKPVYSSKKDDKLCALVNNIELSTCNPLKFLSQGILNS